MPRDIFLSAKKEFEYLVKCCCSFRIDFGPLLFGMIQEPSVQVEITGEGYVHLTFLAIVSWSEYELYEGKGGL